MAYKNLSSKNNTHNIKTEDGEAYLLFRSKWTEHRRKQGNKEGDPYLVPDSRYVTIRFPKGCEGKQVRVFIEVE